MSADVAPGGFDDPGEVDGVGRVVLDALPPDVVAANRAAWVEALRSGDYRQAHEALRAGDGDAPRAEHGFCCLGVAEDVARGGRGWSHTVADDLDGDDDEDDDRPGWSVPDPRVLLRLPSPVTLVGRTVERVALGGAARQVSVLTGRACRWLGVLTTDPVVTVRSLDGTWSTRSLVDLNDRGDLSLAQIAVVVADQPADWDGTDAFALAERARRAAAEGATDPGVAP